MSEESLKYRISLQDLFSKGIHDAEKAGQKFENRIDSIGEHIGELKNQLLGAFIGFEIGDFIKGSADEFIKMEKTAAQLKFTVGQRGGLASDFKDLSDQSDTLGKSSFFNHVEIQAAANQLLNYGVSVKQTKDSLKTLTDVGVAKGKDLSEVISAAGMAAAGGRAMALKEYGLGFLKLEKDMSVAGAEARNFNKIIGAMQKEFGGATDQMQDSEFFKLKKLQDEMAEFKEEVGEGIMKVFDQILPSLREFVEWMKEAFHWIQENATVLKNLALAIGIVWGGFKLMQGAFAILQVITFAFGELKFATMAWLDTEIMASEAMAVTPWGAMAAGIGLLVFAYLQLSESAEEAARKQGELQKKNSQLVTDWEQQGVEVEKNSLNLMLEGKKLAEKQKIIEDEIETQRKFQAELNTNLATGRNEYGKYKAVISFLEDQKKNLLKKPEKLGGEGESLGSGLNEPKASKIQNITINVPYAFQNAFAHMTSQSPVSAMGDVGAQITEFLVSLVQDATIVATE